MYICKRIKKYPRHPGDIGDIGDIFRKPLKLPDFLKAPGGDILGDIFGDGDIPGDIFLDGDSHAQDTIACAAPVDSMASTRAPKNGPFWGGFDASRTETRRSVFHPPKREKTVIPTAGDKSSPDAPCGRTFARMNTTQPWHPVDFVDFVDIFWNEDFHAQDTLACVPHRSIRFDAGNPYYQDSELRRSPDW